jgi:hypothetical protein
MMLPSVVDFAAVSDSHDGDACTFFDEDNAPVADTKPGAVAAFETLYVAGAGFGITFQLGTDAVPDFKLNIAFCDIAVLPRKSHRH